MRALALLFLLAAGNAGAWSFADRQTIKLEEAEAADCEAGGGCAIVTAAVLNQVRSLILQQRALIAAQQEELRRLREEAERRKLERYF